MAEFIPLDDAARLLSVSLDELKDMRSRGEIFGVRDGSSWKFKTEEIERVRSELAGDVLDDDPGGSSILVSERNLGAAGSKLGSTLGGGRSDEDSDLQISDDGDDEEMHSDVALVADPASGSGVRLVNKNPPQPLPADDDDEVLDVPEAEQSGGSLLLGDLDLGNLSGSGSSPSDASGRGGAGSAAGSDVLSGISSDGDDDVLAGDSGELELAGDDDLAVGSESSISLQGGESGINLADPSDSGLSLEDEPLDLAGAGASGLGLGSAGGSDAGGAGLSGIDFAAADNENFELSPSGEMAFEDDSGSQVIELEDSADFAAAPVEGLGMGELDDAAVGGLDDDSGVVGFDAETAAPVGYATASGPEFSSWEVSILLMTLLFLGVAGILMTDVSRNLWAAADGSPVNLNSWLSESIRGILPTS